MKIPKKFEERMEMLLGENYKGFRESLGQKTYLGLRINTLKISVEDFLKINPFKLIPIPWVPEGFYYREEERPTKHPYYHAGLYYIQEPSAMSPGVLLDPQPGETVLDTCAAPGGKTCQIAARMENRGVLVTNDISATRAKALLRNVEMNGIKNAIVLCEDLPKLKSRLAQSFDRILVDAPCSGEGMFRKSDAAIKAWDDSKQESYRAMQEPIVNAAVEMLVDQGVLVYSTCTFNRLENEDLIGDLLDHHDDMRAYPGILPGLVRGMQTVEGRKLESVYRIWPHLAQGEGHFLARLKKERSLPKTVCSRGVKGIEPPECFVKFLNQYVEGWKEFGIYLQIGERLLMAPDHGLDLDGLRIIRTGWHLGDIKRDRFEPSQALAMGLKAEQFKQKVLFKADDPELQRYLKGETLHLDATQGWNLVCVDGFPLGWAKSVSGMLKNHYPPAWRKLD